MRVSNRPPLPGSYDPIARECAEKFIGEIRHKPFDQELLDRFEGLVRGLGSVCDLGCGPGQIARYLHDRRIEVFGLDLSQARVEEARRLNPAIRFVQGDRRALPAEDEAWGGIAAFYSIIHVSPSELPGVIREFRRTIRGGGLLLLAFHVGEEVTHLDEWWGKPVSLDFYFHKLDTVAGILETAGFDLLETQERLPYEGFEYPSQRGYIFARKV